MYRTQTKSPPKPQNQVDDCMDRPRTLRNLPVGGAVFVVLGKGVGPGVAPGDVEERHKGGVERGEVVRIRRPEKGRPDHRR